MIKTQTKFEKSKAKYYHISLQNRKNFYICAQIY